MKITKYPSIDKLIKELLNSLKSILGEKLLGLYLGGSLVIGDFDSDISDIDLTAVLSSRVNDKEFVALKSMHDGFAKTHSDWYDRIEMCYITFNALKNVKSQASVIVNISPGEPIHRMKSNLDWLMNWYLLSAKSIAVFGTPASSFVQPISKEEFISAVRRHILNWSEYIVNTKHYPANQAYIILTMCRGLYTSKFGEQVSKKKAAEWTIREFPEWTTLIDNAIKWRQEWRNQKSDGEKTFPETKRFVNFAIDQIRSSGN